MSGLTWSAIDLRTRWLSPLLTGVSIHGANDYVLSTSTFWERCGPPIQALGASTRTLLLHKFMDLMKEFLEDGEFHLPTPTITMCLR